MEKPFNIQMKTPYEVSIVRGKWMTRVSKIYSFLIMDTWKGIVYFPLGFQQTLAILLHRYIYV